MAINYEDVIETTCVKRLLFLRYNIIMDEIHPEVHPGVLISCVSFLCRGDGDRR